MRMPLVFPLLYIAGRFAGRELLVHHPKKHISAMWQGRELYMALTESILSLITVGVIQM